MQPAFSMHAPLPTFASLPLGIDLRASDRYNHSVPDGHYPAHGVTKERIMANCDNTRPCPCTYPCPRHGKCCECVAYHRDKEGGVTGCFFSKEGEATWDRSVEALWRDHNNRK